MRPDDTINFRKLSLEEAQYKLLYADELVTAVRHLACGTGATDADAVVAGAEASARARVAASGSLPAAQPLLKALPKTDTHPGAEYR